MRLTPKSLPRLQALGYAAGTIIALSALPRIVDLCVTPGVAIHESITRNAALVLGNLIWVVYGSVNRNRPVALMCGVGALFNSLVLALAVWAHLQID